MSKKAAVLEPPTTRAALGDEVTLDTPTTVSDARILRALLNQRGSHGMGVPLIVWGPPGVGKTATIMAVAKELGLHLEVVILSVRDPSDVAGLPANGPEGVTLHPPAWAKRIAALAKDPNHPGSIVFFDELSCAAPATQAAALRVFSERVVGDLPLPHSTRIVAAANPPEQAAGGWGLAGPMANRLVHLNWKIPTANEWAAWIKAQDGNDPRAAATVANFVVRNPALLLDLPKNESDAGGAWPSPRSWEAAVKALSAALRYKLPLPDRERLVYGAVGEGAGKEMLTYLDSLDLPDPEAVLAGTEEVPYDPKRLDRTHVVVTAVVMAALSQHPDRANRAAAAFKLLIPLKTKAADVAISGVTQFCRALADDRDNQIRAAVLRDKVCVEALTKPDAGAFEKIAKLWNEAHARREARRG